MSQTSIATARISALQQAGIEPGYLDTPGIRMRELKDVGLVRLRSLLEPESLQQSLAGCGIELPVQGNQSRGHDPLVLCMRPGEWLLISELDQKRELMQRLKAALESGERSSGQSVDTALLDCSDGHAVLRLSGKATPWLLNKISSVDFLAAPAVGQHALRTRMGQIAVVLSYHPADEGSSEFVFDLIFDRSVAGYLWQLLLTSVPHARELAAEFGQEHQ